jgi:hypothetical protein
MSEKDVKRKKGNFFFSRFPIILSVGIMIACYNREGEKKKALKKVCARAKASCLLDE